MSVNLIAASLCALEWLVLLATLQLVVYLRGIMGAFAQGSTVMQLGLTLGARWPVLLSDHADN